MAFTDLDDDLFAPDANASAFASVQTRANIVGLREDRHVGMSWCGTIYAPNRPVSTHPRAWWGTPMLVNVYPGATALRVTVHLVATVADGKVRLSCGGRVSSETTITTSAGDSFVTLTVALPDVATPQRMRAAIEFQSGIGSTLGKVEVEAWDGNFANIKDAGGGGAIIPTSSSWTDRHYAMLADEKSGLVEWTDGYYYVGASVTSFADAAHRNLRVWPASEQGTTIDSSTDQDVSIYPLTQFVTYGYTADVTGDGARVPTTEVGNVYAGADIYGSDIYSLHRTAAQVYETRRHVAPMGATPTGDNRTAFGRTTGLIADAMLEARSDVVAIEAACLAAPNTATDMEFRWQFDTAGRGDSTGGWVTTHDVALGTDNTARGLGERAGVSANGTLAALGAVHPAWGARDLMHCAPGESDLYRLQLIESRLNLTGEAWVVGDTYVIRASTGIDTLLTLGGQVSEVIQTGGE